MPHTCDLLVVGGGVIGTSIAFELARRGVGRVVLLEKAYLGAGASGKAAALVHRCHDHPATASLAHRGLPVFEHFGDAVGGPAVLFSTGMVRLGRDRAALEADVAGHRERGTDVRLMTDHELMEVDPNARLAEDEVAAFERKAGHVEAVQVVASFAEAARRAGADVHQGVEVKAVLADKGKAAGVETNEGAYHCGRLVLATGAWAARLLGTLQVDLPVRAARAQVALFRRPADSGRRGVVFCDAVQGLYLRPAQGDLIHAGDLAVAGEPGIDPDDYNEAADRDWLPDIRQRLIRRYPAMHCGFGRGGYGAPVALTPDGLPVVDRLPGLEGVFCAAGFGAEGFAVAPAVARLLAAWVVEDRDEPDLAPFGLARFAAGQGADAEQAPAERGS